MVYRPVSINPDQAVAKIQQAQQLGMQDATRGIQNIGQTMQFVKGIGDQQAYRKAMGAYLDEIGGEQPVIQPATGKQLTTDEQEAILMQGGLDTPEKMEEFISDTATLTADNADPVQAANKLMVRAQNLESQGRDASDSKQLASLFMQNPQAAKASIGNINQMIQNKNFREMLKRNPDAAMGFAKSLGVGAGVSESEKARLQEDADVRKELRGDLRGRMKELDKSINVLETNYKKIQNLSGEVEKGNRSAIAQTLVAMVKLNDPNSAVLNSEMEAAINTQNPVAAVAQYLQGKNVGSDVINSITANFDPLSPDVIKVDQIQATADAMLSANVDSMVSSYGEAKALGGNLGASGIKSIFTKSRDERLGRLSKIGKSSSKPINKKQTTSGFKVGKKYTDSQGNSAIYQADGTWKEL